MGDVLMRGEFLSVVEGDGVHEVADRLEATHAARGAKTRVCRIESGRAHAHPEGSRSVLNLSESWLAKARMRGDGPPYLKPGHSVRYPEIPLLRWIRARLRLSTSEL